VGQVEKPWAALGMSRSKWYRLGKPTVAPSRLTQKRAVQQNASLRAIQRGARILRLSPIVAAAVSRGEMSLGSAEKMAVAMPTWLRILEGQNKKNRPQGLPPQLPKIASGTRCKKGRAVIKACR
jgi:hypothetical protein